MSAVRVFVIAIAFALLITARAPAADTFTLDRGSDGSVSIKVNGDPFATYVLDKGNKPYLWPIFGPDQKQMTRAFPMQEIAGEQRDHPHHRGITFGHEHIDDGTDVWTEPATYKPDSAQLAKLGTVKHHDFTELKADNDRAVIAETLDYLDHDGKRLLTEHRRITFHLLAGDMRAIDFDQDLIASDGPVRFADSKDAGLSIRVPTSTAVDSKKGGRIINSNGITDADAWGKPASWCDYNGPVDGEQLGIAMLNHPTSWRYPTPWHVRTYGLFGANPFGSKVFDKSEPDKGIELKAGEQIHLRHRFIFHRGDEKTARIAEAFEAYAKE